MTIICLRSSKVAREAAQWRRAAAMCEMQWPDVRGAVVGLLQPKSLGVFVVRMAIFEGALSWTDTE